MFFTDYIGVGRGPRRAHESLAIFGNVRSRRGSEMKAMGAIEIKLRGYFTREDVLQDWVQRSFVKNEDFGSVTLPFKGDEQAFALGKDASTKKKLLRASGAIIEYIGQYAVVSGTKKERQRGLTYLQWLLMQRAEGGSTGGVVTISDSELREDGRDDITIINDKNVIDLRASLRTVEAETGTFIFLEGRAPDERLFICAGDSSARDKAEGIIREMLRGDRPFLREISGSIMHSQRNEFETGPMVQDGDGKEITITLPDDMAQSNEIFFSNNWINMVGGCCGATPTRLV